MSGRRGAGWMILGAALVVAVVSTVPASQAHESAPPLSLGEYGARLDDAERRLSQGADPTDPAVQAALGGTITVRLASGATVLAQPLVAEGASREAALERVRLAQAQLAAADNDRTADRLAQLQTVLARSEFSAVWQEPNLWQRLGEWLRAVLEWLSGVLPAPSGQGNPAGAAASRGLVWLVAGVGGVAIALLFGYWLSRLLGVFVADAEARRRREAGEEEPVTAAAARQQAVAQAQAGQYRQAVRSLYLSALLRLEERGLVRADRSLTNREYLAQVAGQAEVQRHLQPVVQTFDDVWYGVREPDRATFLHYQQEIDALNEAIS